jgi:hypothetical protein
MFMQELTPLLNCKVEGHDLLFSFDTGASGTIFSLKFFRTFQDELKSLKKTNSAIAGAGGRRSLSSVKAPEVKIGIGDATAVLKNADVFTAPLGTDVDLLYGNMGRDVTNQFRSFTLDFKAMRFRVQK